MKKILALAVVAIASISASAQVYVGGSFSLERNTTKNQTNFSIAPEIGHNFNSKTAVGGTVEFTHNYDSGTNSNIFSVNPYFRYKFLHVDHLTVFLDTTVGVGIGNSKVGDEKSKTATIWDAGFKPGIAYDLSDHFTIVAHLGFIGVNGANHAAKYAGYDNKFGIDFSTSNLEFGLSYSF